MMTLQGFLHFLKIMRLANNRHEVMNVCQSLHELIHLPLSDTLNVRNGLNYSLFLESILRVAYAKLDDSEYAGSDNGYKNVLE